MKIIHKTSLPLTLLVLLSAPACGAFSGEGSEEAPLADPGAAAAPPPPVTGTPPVDELTEAFGVFVVAGAKDDTPGTRAAPLGSIAKAVEKARANKRRVYVCAGRYAEAITLANGVSVIGALECDGDRWRPGEARASLVSPSSPAVSARDITDPTRLEGLDVTAPEGTPESPTSIALIATSAGALTIAHASFRAEKAADGAPGVAPEPAVHVGDPNGAAPSPESDPLASIFPAQVPAFRASPYARQGSAGGDGACSAGPRAESGGRSQGGALARGVWSQNNFSYFWQDSVVGAAREIRSGAPGVPGAAGRAGGSGTFSSAGFSPATGSVGADGTAGRGGSGGASLPFVRRAPIVDGYAWHATGGGGGAGGCAGLAGTPGHGGGASVAAIVIDSPSLSLEDVRLSSSSGGAGGPGSFGSPPSLGGAAGGGETIPFAVAGGVGGAAGPSGSGAGGPSYALAHTGGAPKTSSVKLLHGAAGAGVAEESLVALDGTTQTLAASRAGQAEDEHAF